MDIKASITIAAPLARVWQVAGDDFGNVGAWATGVYSSELHPGATRTGRAANLRDGLGLPRRGTL